MPLFVLFVFGAVILGAGAMLSPAWPTNQPRVGLAASMALAVVSGGTIFYASLFGWDTLVIDYLMFALMTSIFLGGTLSIGQTRAEARGEELLDENQGWPGPQDLSMFALLAVALTWIALALPIPFGSEGQATALIALAMREGGTLNTLAPFIPVDVLNPPAFNALTAYLSQQLNSGIHTTQLATGAVLALMAVWMAYDFGAELRDKRLGRAMAQVMVASLALFGLLMNGHYPALMGTVFTLACFTYGLRYLRHRYPVDLVGAGLLMGATFLTDFTAFTVLIAGFVAFIAAIWLDSTPEKRGAGIRLALIAPLIALAGVAPWLSDVWGLFTAGLESPYARSFDNVYVLIFNHGIWVWPVLALGAWLAWTKQFIREEVGIAFWAIAWLILIFDLAISGGVSVVFGFLTRYADPTLVAWQGAIIPVSVLGGLAMLWAWDTQFLPRFNYHMPYRHAYIISAVGITLLIVLFQPLRNLLGSAYTTQGDVEALAWVRDNLPEDAYLYTLSPLAGTWTTAIAERPSTLYPDIPFLRIVPDEVIIHWQDVESLQESGVTHIFLPEALARELGTAVNSAEHLDNIHNGRVFEVK